MGEPSTSNLNLELSTQYYQQGTLEKDLWFRVATQDYTQLMQAIDFSALLSHFDSPIELLDVGCGTGKFPLMLAPHISAKVQIPYDYLDPSQHSLNELRKALSFPFIPRTAFQTTLESLKRSACPPQGYQVIWCLQSLYCLQREALHDVMEKLYSLLNPSTGIGLIYLASSASFYHRVYNLYNQEIHPNVRQPYVTAEEVAHSLETLHIPIQVKKLHFPHTISMTEEAVLKNYLNQCVFDAKAWEHSQRNLVVNQFLKEFRAGNGYQFPQQVWLIMFKANTQIMTGSNKQESPQ
ncbi:MAG: class I SAM-dependent methyltransferase [Nitrospirales bacterium]